jgi:hypothetical protein
VYDNICGSHDRTKSVRALAERNPAFNAILTAVADEIGVPKDLKATVLYAEAVITELDRRGESVPSQLKILYDLIRSVHTKRESDKQRNPKMTSRSFQGGDHDTPSGRG